MVNLIYMTIAVSFVWMLILAMIMSSKADAFNRQITEVENQYQPEAEAGRSVEYRDSHDELQFATLLNSLRKSDRYVIISRMVKKNITVRLVLDRKHLVRVMSKEFDIE